MPLIEVSGLTKTYRVDGSVVPVLKGISLSIEEGEFVAIVGRSGSGKSTLLQILGLLDKPSSGRYLLAGRDTSMLDDEETAFLRSRTIGFVFQMFNLLARTSALENVALPMVYAGSPNRLERSKELLGLVGLSDRLEHAPNQLSGGQQQRVAIARSLANSPRIVFADEPTGNLATEQADDIMRQLEELHSRGMTVIIVTHDPEIAVHAERVLHIKDGLLEKDVKGAPRRPPAAAAKETPPVPLARPPVSLAAFAEYAKSALRATAANKTRSFLSILGILIGVGAVIAMLAIGRGAQKAMEARIRSLGSNLIIIYPTAGSKGPHGFQPITWEDVRAISKLPHVTAVDPNSNGQVRVVYGDKNADTSVDGVTTAYPAMHDAQPYYGRFFTEAENLRMARVALLGQTVVAELFGKTDPVGKTVTLNRIGFKVIGVMPAKGASGFRDQDDVVVVPLMTALRRVLGQTYPGMMYVQCDDESSVAKVTAAIHKLWQKRHHVLPQQSDSLLVRDLSSIKELLTGTAKTMTLLLGIVAAISLLVGGIGIMNIMLVSVSERTREIGLRKAIGASRRAILLQFLIESTVLSFLGGVAGILLGWSVAFGMSHFAGWAAIVSPGSVILAFGFSVGVGVVFGFWPARKASLLSPIEALRYE